MKKMPRSLWLSALSVVMLSACGTSHRALTSAPIIVRDSTAAASQAGAVDVTVADANTNRGVSSVVSDVAGYRVTLTGGTLTQPLVKQCAAPANSNGKVSVRFDALDAGTYAMTVEVLGATGNVLGSDTQSGTVVPGQCTYIDLHVKLQNTIVTPTQGSLGARVTVTNGDTVQRPIENCPANDGFVPLDGSACPAVSATPSPAPSRR